MSTDISCHQETFNSLYFLIQANMQVDLWEKKKSIKRKLDSLVKDLKHAHIPNVNDVQVGS